LIKLNPYSWQDVEYWFEDEEEIFEFMRENEDMIVKYSLENGMNFMDSIEYLFMARD